ncbi:MAG: DUF3892 domain-containing protein [Defluviitaleaceae bacterium]|nr:DUF3892 domain-containing protein [Defluviitaleaceae bacterium]
MSLHLNQGHGLPFQALKEVPEVQAGAREITALVKKSGKVTGYQLSDGHIVSKEQGIELAKQGQIAGVGIATNRGTEYLKSLPDVTEANNLGNLPSVADMSEG